VFIVTLVNLVQAGVLPASLVLLAGAAFANVIPVTNPSFETLPPGGLPNNCGVGCAFSTTAIPGWTGGNGQFQPGTQAGNFTFFSALSDGITSAYTSGPTISQTVTTTVVPGVIYTLQVDLGWRNDMGAFASGADLLINGVLYVATGSTPVQGHWSTFTATYTGRPADAGDPITIQLVSTGTAQSNFDNVRLANNIPEPGTTAALAIGLAGFYLLRRRQNV
jgi:hypothetical protein